MLDIPFRRNADPITDGEILVVVDTIRPILVAGLGPDVMIAFLLAKMLFRIEQLRAAAGLPPIDCRLPLGEAVAVRVSWEPKFEAISHEQEQLAIKFSSEIAGPKGGKPSLPDPVRLLEMAHALYLAERNDSTVGELA